MPSDHRSPGSEPDSDRLVDQVTSELVRMANRRRRLKRWLVFVLLPLLVAAGAGCAYFWYPDATKAWVLRMQVSLQSVLKE